jgi:hypothetical protein
MIHQRRVVASSNNAYCGNGTVDKIGKSKVYTSVSSAKRQRRGRAVQSKFVEFRFVVAGEYYASRIVHFSLPP